MQSLEHWLRLWHTPGVGPKTFNHLLNIFKDPKDVYETSYSTLVESGLTQQLAKTILANKANGYLVDLEWLGSNPRHHIVTIHSSLYPQELRHIQNPPPILYAAGDIKLLTTPQKIALVGSRKATHSAQTLAYEFAHNLSKLGFVIVSGLARGIDAQAHQGAMKFENGKTISVYANGLDITYPIQHKSLAKNIQNQGILMTEFPPNTKPLPQHFPRRNRIISGLSLGVIIIEAAAKSGTLITAKYALEQDREVFVIPGQIFNPLNAGSHQLIQEGAKLISSIDDIMIELQCHFIDQIEANNDSRKVKPIPADLNRLLNIIDYSPMPIEIIIAKSGLTPEQVSSMLMELEIGGHVVSDAYGQYSRSAADVI